MIVYPILDKNDNCEKFTIDYLGDNKMIIVEQIIKQYLDTHGYDGLYNENGCKCKLALLCPCSNIGKCIPGYLQPDGQIGPDKPEKKYKPIQKGDSYGVQFICSHCGEPKNDTLTMEMKECCECGVALDWSDWIK